MPLKITIEKGIPMVTRHGDGVAQDLTMQIKDMAIKDSFSMPYRGQSAHAAVRKAFAHYGWECAIRCTKKAAPGEPGQLRVWRVA